MKQRLAIIMTIFSVTLWICSTSRADVDTVTVNYQFTIEPVFAVQIQADQGGSLLNFGTVMPDSQSRQPALTVVVATNTDEDYRLFHRLNGDLSTEEGFDPVEKHVSFRVTDGKNGGVSQVATPQPLTNDKVEIFQSKPQGGSDSFQIQYFLDEEHVFSAGNYYGDIQIEIEK